MFDNLRLVFRHQLSGKYCLETRYAWCDRTFFIMLLSMTTSLLLKVIEPFRWRTEKLFRRINSFALIRTLAYGSNAIIPCERLNYYSSPFPHHSTATSGWWYEVPWTTSCNFWKLNMELLTRRIISLLPRSKLKGFSSFTACLLVWLWVVIMKCNYVRVFQVMFLPFWSYLPLVPLVPFALFHSLKQETSI